jgi:hypothetical protein
MGVHHASKLAWNAFGQPLRSLPRKISHQARLPPYSFVRYINARRAIVVQLPGLNLQTADADRKSGFDTCNRVALGLT